MPSFSEHFEALPGLLTQLLEATPVAPEAVPVEAPAQGVYLFSEGDRHLYVGRSDHLRTRIAQHCRPSSRHTQAAFAIVLAREETGFRATYQREGSLTQLMINPVFVAAFDRAKARIRTMGVSYVPVADPMRQALFEIYAADALQTPYNSWANH